MGKIDTRQVAENMKMEHWASVIADCQASGQSNRAYCEANGINEKRYYYWLHKLREAACRKMSEQEVGQEVRQIVELQVPEQTAPINAGKIVIRLGKAEVEIQGDVNPALVEGALRALGC